MRTCATRILAAVMAACLPGLLPVLGQTAPAPTASRPAQSQAAPRPFSLRWVNPADSLPAGARHETFHSPAMNCDVGYCIYLPPGYADGNARYPVLYWLHGRGGNELTGLHYVPLLNQAIVSGRIPPMLMVIVNGGADTMYCDSVDRTIMADSAIARELIPYIDSHYRTIAKREGRVIEGFSMGGAGALKFAFKYPELFCSAVGGAPALNQSWERMIDSDHAERTRRMFANDRRVFESERVVTWLKKNADRIRGRVSIRIVVGDQDRLKPNNDALCKQLDELKIPYEYEVLEGIGHSGDQVYEKVGLKGFQFQAAGMARSGLKPH